MNIASKTTLCLSTLLSTLACDRAHAFILNSPVQEFMFGPDGPTFSQTATLNTFNQPGILLGVHIELSGETAFTLTATSGDTPGTVFGMTEDVSFSLSGLPFASLSAMVPTYAVGSFALPANSSQSFTGSLATPVAATDLTELFELAAYDVSAGAPATVDFTFHSEESFSFMKSGSGLAAGSEVSSGGKVRVWYVYDNFQPPPEVPETTTALSSTAFAVGLLFYAWRRSVRTAAHTH